MDDASGITGERTAVPRQRLQLTAKRNGHRMSARSTAPLVTQTPGATDLPAPSQVHLSDPPAPAEVLLVPTRYLRWGGKAIFDRVGALLLVLLLLPIIVSVALVVRVQLGRGVLYCQRRVGRGGQVFDLYKFRTMEGDRRRADVSVDPAEDRRVSHKRDDDPRHTELGRLLRKLSLDELPQLWHVLIGQMSLVGPRPELDSVVQRYGLRDHPRHLVKPGITGVWQISPARAQLLHEGVALDLDYLEDITFRRDVSILLRTVGVVIGRSGA